MLRYSLLRAALKASEQRPNATLRPSDMMATRSSTWVPDDAHFASAVDFKAPIRAEIERIGYTIIENMGDQPSDLLGGHAEKDYLLPDPFYRVP